MPEPLPQGRPLGRRGRQLLCPSGFVVRGGGGGACRGDHAGTAATRRWGRGPRKGSHRYALRPEGGGARSAPGVRQATPLLFPPQTSPGRTASNGPAPGSSRKCTIRLASHQHAGQVYDGLCLAATQPDAGAESRVVPTVAPAAAPLAESGAAWPVCPGSQPDVAVAAVAAVFNLTHGSCRHI